MELSLVIIIIVIIFTVFSYFVCCYNEDGEHKERDLRDTLNQRHRRRQRISLEDGFEARPTDLRSNVGSGGRYPNTIGFAATQEDTPGVTVTTTHHAASPVVNPPYPIDPRHPTPYAVPQQLGFTGVQNAGYPPVGAAPAVYPAHPAPYPPTNVSTIHPSNVTPYPPTSAPYPPTSAPYPPVTARANLTSPSAPLADSAQPPSYYEATGQAVSSSAKQPPYPQY